jgi:hypothetical protein
MLAMLFYPEDGRRTFLRKVSELYRTLRCFIPSWILFCWSGVRGTRGLLHRDITPWARGCKSEEKMALDWLGRDGSGDSLPWTEQSLGGQLHGTRVLLETPTVAHLLKKIPTFYRTRKFITVLTRAFHRSLSWARLIYTTFQSYIFKICFIIILPSVPSSCFYWSLVVEFFYLNFLFIFFPCLLHVLPIPCSLNCTPL